MVLTAIAIFLLHDSEQPESTTAESKDVPVTVPVTVTGMSPERHTHAARNGGHTGGAPRAEVQTGHIGYRSV